MGEMCGENFQLRILDAHDDHGFCRTFEDALRDYHTRNYKEYVLRSSFLQP